jgi:hypothetical protein
VELPAVEAGLTTRRRRSDSPEKSVSWSVPPGSQSQPKHQLQATVSPTAIVVEFFVTMDEPVTPEEIKLVLALLGDDIASLFRED